MENKLVTLVGLAWKTVEINKYISMHRCTRIPKPIYQRILDKGSSVDGHIKEIDQIQYSA